MTVIPTMQIGDFPSPNSPSAQLLIIMIMVRSVGLILDIDECAGDTHNCSRNNATCTNTEGSFGCSCKQGFTGNGHKCEGRILETSYYLTIDSMWESSQSSVNFHRLAVLLVSTDG